MSKTIKTLINKLSLSNEIISNIIGLFIGVGFTSFFIWMMYSIFGW
jgi:hypothetical protein